MSAVALREVRLYGHLGRRFGRVFHLAVRTAAEAAHALCQVLPGFEAEFLKHQAGYHVFIGRGDRRRDIGEAQAADPVSAREPIRFVPVIQGAKRSGLLQFIVGAALLFLAPAALAVTIGKALMLGGIISLLSPQPKKTRDTKAENQPSYGYDGPTNVAEPGSMIPILMGRVVVGSVVLSQGLTADDIVVPPSTAPASNATLRAALAYMTKRKYPTAS